jgi:hypothetical protein
MESSTDFSGSLRRHPNSPNFWLAVLAGSLAVHLVFLLSGQWLLVRVAPVKSGGSSTPIELVDLPQKSSGQPIQARSLASPKTSSAPPASFSSAASSIQSSEPTQPTIVPSPLPKPIQERRSPTQPPPVPQRSAPPAKPISPEPTSPENTAQPNPQPSDGEKNPPIPPQPENTGQPNPQPSDGEENPTTPPQPPNSGTPPDQGVPPGISGPSESGQTLPSTQVTIAAQVTTDQIRRAPARQSDVESTARLRGSAPSQITIPYSPDLKLLPGQVLDLEVYFVVDTTSGKVISASVPTNSTSMSDAGLDRLVNQVFEPLLFDVTFDTAAVNKAQLTDWVVPVQIQVVK